VNNSDLAEISEELATIVKPKSIAQLCSLVERKFEEKFCLGNRNKEQN